MVLDVESAEFLCDICVYGHMKHLNSNDLTVV